jgi:circadian clock protein KaiB
MKRAARRGAPFKFRLYVAGDTQNTAQAVANLIALCRAELPDRHDIEIVNVYEEPKRALGDGIFMTPTLIKLMPSPVQRIVGTLSETPLLLHALGLAHASA